MQRLPNETIGEFLSRIATPDHTWMAEAEERIKNRDWLTLSAHIAIDVLTELRKQNLTKRDLAEMMGCSPQYVSKIVKGSENLTLETICKLEKALKVKLIHSAFSINHPNSSQVFQPEEQK